MRRELDAYYTPHNMTRVLLDSLFVRWGPYPIIIEPCVGNGAIADVLKERIKGADIVTNDIDRSVPASHYGDAADPYASVWEETRLMGTADWTITNPPFSCAREIADIALGRSDNVALLLRLSFLEPTKDRQPFWYKWGDSLTDVIIFGQPRPSFTGDGKTDSVTTAWFVWRQFGDRNTKFRWATNWNWHAGEVKQ